MCRTRFVLLSLPPFCFEIFFSAILISFLSFLHTEKTIEKRILNPFLFFSLLLFHFSHYFFIYLRAGWNRKLKEMVYTLTTGVQLTGLSANTDHCKEQQTYLNSLK